MAPTAEERLGVRWWHAHTLFIPDCIEVVEPEMFKGCTVRHVRIAAGVREIGTDAFRGCHKL